MLVSWIVLYFVRQRTAEQFVDHEQNAGRWKRSHYSGRQTAIHAGEALLSIGELRQLDDAFVSFLYLYVGFD